MATESWVLDGIPLTSGNFGLLELEANPPKSRADWLTAADSENGVLMREPFHENRVITMKLRVAAQASMDAALDQVAAVRDKFRSASRAPDGIALVWTPANSTRARTFDVLNGEITEIPIATSDQGVSWLLAQRPVFTVEMTCKPYWRGTETVTSSASASAPFVTLAVSGVTGDVPALSRLIVTETATQHRRHLEWGIENQFYDASTSLLVDSDNMTVTGFAGAQTTRAGAYDPNASGNNVIRATVYRVPLGVCGTGNLSHVGTYRVKARVYASTLDVRVRLAWQAGDAPFAANGYAAPAVAGAFSEVDLGVITIPTVAAGTQRWSGRVEAYSATAGDTIDVDYLILVPAGEGYGRSRAVIGPVAGTVGAYDEFTGLGVANLNTRAAPLGGSWATSGVATDFAGNTSSGGEAAYRGTLSDASRRFAILGTTNYTDVQSEVHMRSSGWSGSQVTGGVIARWTDASNYAYAMLHSHTSGSFSINQVVAGAGTVIAQGSFIPSPNQFYGIRLVVYSTGVVIAEIRQPAVTSAPLATLKGYSSALATGGTLATGKPGFFDQNSAAVAYARYYDWFTVASPVSEPIVLYSGRTAEFRYNGAFRQDSSGTYYGRPVSYRGSFFLVPPGTSRVLAKARRNDIEAAPDDTVTDALQIAVGWTPRGLTVPR